VPLVDLPGSAGMLATGGGLVFTGKLTGAFVALDAATGRLHLDVRADATPEPINPACCLQW
jgi:glucose dehydrogenase